jgi:hypothetical protein
MRIPEGEYTVESFLDTVSSLGRKVLSEEDARNEIKMFFYITDLEDPLSLFSTLRTKRMGEVLQVQVPRDMERDDDEHPDNYYALQYDDNIVLLVSSVTLKRHHPNVGRHISTSPGITDMWLNPSIVLGVLDDLEERYPSMRIGNLIARRNPGDGSDCVHRPGFERRVNYTGQDGLDVLKELRHYYGVHPVKVNLDLAPKVNLNLYEEGYFVLRDINRETVSEVRHILSLVRDDVLSLYSTAKQMRFEATLSETRMGTVSTPVIHAGEVTFASGPVTGPVAEEFVRGSPDFSFVDVTLEEGSLNLSAIVIDEVRNAVFDVSGTEDRLAIVPKSDAPFDSFIRFYRYVTESLDSRASFAPMVS